MWKSRTVLFLISFLLFFALWSTKLENQLLFSPYSSVPPCNVNHTDQEKEEKEVVVVVVEEEQNRRLYTTEGHNFLSADGLREDGLAVLTKRVQRYIWEKQHPPKDACASAKYLYGWWPHGFGSQMHVAGSQLAKALEEDRIFYWGKTTGREFASPELCGTVNNWLCFFQPPTNCSTDDYANEGNTVKGDVSEKLVPTVFVQWLKEVAPHINAKYWWRAQSTAYLMRLNQHTLEAVSELRKSNSMAMLSPAENPTRQQVLRLPQPVFPLPRGTLSLHVRHGDKYKEMQLQPYSKYMAGADYLTAMNPNFLRPLIFLSTDDPAVVQESFGYTEWATIYSDISRVNSNGADEVAKTPNAAHLHLLQLLMALECDAWVGTRGSNWNRLIDELRCIWVAKCDHPYFEVADQEKDLGWR